MAKYESMTFGTDGLVYGLNPKTEAFMVTIKANAGALKRGTVLAVDADNKMVVLGSGTGTANCVLCDDTEVGASDVVAAAYCAGHFTAEKLAVLLFANVDFAAWAAKIETGFNWIINTGIPFLIQNLPTIGFAIAGIGAAFIAFNFAGIIAGITTGVTALSCDNSPSYTALVPGSRRWIVALA